MAGRAGLRDAPRRSAPTAAVSALSWCRPFGVMPVELGLAAQLRRRPTPPRSTPPFHPVERRVERALFDRAPPRSVASSIQLAMPYPWRGPRDRVLRISASSVPWRIRSGRSLEPWVKPRQSGYWTGRTCEWLRTRGPSCAVSQSPEPDDPDPDHRLADWSPDGRGAGGPRLPAALRPRRAGHRPDVRTVVPRRAAERGSRWPGSAAC